MSFRIGPLKPCLVSSLDRASFIPLSHVDPPVIKASKPEVPLPTAPESFLPPYIWKNLSDFSRFHAAVVTLICLLRTPFPQIHLIRLSFGPTFVPILCADFTELLYILTSSVTIYTCIHTDFISYCVYIHTGFIRVTVHTYDGYMDIYISISDVSLLCNPRWRAC